MIRNVTSRGRKMVTIIDPHIKRDSGYFVHSDATANGYYVKDRDGNDFDGQWRWLVGGGTGGVIVTTRRTNCTTVACRGDRILTVVLSVNTSPEWRGLRFFGHCFSAVIGVLTERRQQPWDCPDKRYTPAARRETATVTQQLRCAVCIVSETSHLLTGSRTC